MADYLHEFSIRIRTRGEPEGEEGSISEWAGGAIKALEKAIFDAATEIFGEYIDEYGNDIDVGSTSMDLTPGAGGET